MLNNDGIYLSIMCKKISGWSLCKGGYLISLVRVTGYFHKGHLEHTQVYNENGFSSLVQHCSLVSLACTGPLVAQE